ncbi:uncharacterized protein MONBRDRAFT_28797 [Monosiga brevicollis MX1]|uniref:phosphoinositide 5-phosphatase n=1 Tax=Monosiga brevicollis TaxID=81824 RepID=A9V9G6_MONBE|nr:uncharacterized protein MONBRDRAFT_28797 [Monosiga brevicollis MX1]EDQ85859.1 predicted protein [Monosiga brevicollis MX1]|eukprot:XP_001749338.1 hypothetical protein [Monosiga brevicollis MX1]
MGFTRNFRVLEHQRDGSIFLLNRTTGLALWFRNDGKFEALTAPEYELHGQELTKRYDVYGAIGVLELPTEKGSDVTAPVLLVVMDCKSNGRLPGCQVYHISRIDLVYLASAAHDERPHDYYCTYLKQLFATGSFYFSAREESLAPGANFTASARLTVHLPSACQRASRSPGERDSSYFWTRVPWTWVSRHGIASQDWLLPVIRGSVQIRTVYAGSEQICCLLVSRLSNARSGMRFNTRGVDDEGNAANFVETEQVIFAGKHILSFVIARGSVPIFWSQPGLNVGQHKVQLTREFAATQPAFQRHFDQLAAAYGHTVIVSLLGLKGGEYTLESQFEKHASTYDPDMPFVHFDVHAKCRGNKKAVKMLPLVKQLRTWLTSDSFFSLTGKRVNHEQLGIIRVNCLDCLDRTNLCQSVVGLAVLEDMLGTLKSELDLRESKLLEFRRVFALMWSVNGDNVSRCVTGTGAISGGVKTSKLKDMQRSVVRTFKNNFMDSRRQAAIDLLLGTYRDGQADELVIPNVLMRQRLDEAMRLRINDYSDVMPINGLCIDEWLIRPRSRLSEDQGNELGIYAIGFQEMVDLNASNMIKTAQTNRLEWANEICTILGDDYALLTSVQLVGICLFVLVRTDLVDVVRDVCTCTVKTGAGGKVGNKGAVAVRLRLYNTPICFICSHLTAGKSHVAERNQDYHDIYRRIDFGKGRVLDSHSAVFWFGDFNYRIDLENLECRQACADKDLATLKEHDQLTRERARLAVFDSFNEPPIHFLPTYKYDFDSDVYDTSEKQRVPSWTDRAQQIDMSKELRVREEILIELRKELATLAVECQQGNLPAVVVQRAMEQFGAVVIVDQLPSGYLTLVTFAAIESAEKALRSVDPTIEGLPVSLRLLDGSDAGSWASFDTSVAESFDLSDADVDDSGISTADDHEARATLAYLDQLSSGDLDSALAEDDKESLYSSTTSGSSRVMGRQRTGPVVTKARSESRPPVPQHKPPRPLSRKSSDKPPLPARPGTSSPATLSTASTTGAGSSVASTTASSVSSSVSGPPPPRPMPPRATESKPPRPEPPRPEPPRPDPPRAKPPSLRSSLVESELKSAANAIAPPRRPSPPRPIHKTWAKPRHIIVYCVCVRVRACVQWM